MANPQQPELARSRRNPALNPDATETRRQGEARPAATGPGGPVPEDNRPGHHPDHEQDKPDPAAFVAKVQERVREAEPDRPAPRPPAPPVTVTTTRPDAPSPRAELVAAVATLPLRAVEKVLGAVARRL